MYVCACDPVDCSLPGSSVHRILQATMLEWGGFSFLGDPPKLGIKPASLASPALTGRFFTTGPPGKPREVNVRTLGYQLNPASCSCLDSPPPTIVLSFYNHP